MSRLTWDNTGERYYETGVKQGVLYPIQADGKYSMRDCYELIVIARRPDHPVIKKLLALPYCSYDRHYIADNLNHDVLTIYY